MSVRIIVAPRPEEADVGVFIRDEKGDFKSCFYLTEGEANELLDALLEWATAPLTDPGEEAS